MAKSSKGLVKTTREVIVSELEEDMSVELKRSDLGDSYVDSLRCTINSYRYEDDLEWFKDGEVVHDQGYPSMNFSQLI